MIETEILFLNEDIDFNLEQQAHFQNWLLEVIRQESKAVAKLNYVFCSDEYLLQVNRQFLDHDYYTDIISFPMNTDPVSGDILISVDRVRENAKTYSTSFEREMGRVLVHGLLHFLGYDDKEPGDKKRMRKKEDHYLHQLGL